MEAFRRACAGLLLVAVCAPVRAQAPASPGKRPDQLYWFTPNPWSADLPRLFTEPGAWEHARRKIDVFKFYFGQFIGQFGADKNVDPVFVRQIGDAGIAIAVEAPAVKPGNCDGAKVGREVLAVIERIESAGARVRYVAMDEPYVGGVEDFGAASCRLTPEQAARETVRYIWTLRDARPDLLVGDIEPYPRFTAAELKRWVRLLYDDPYNYGQAPLSFFHLDGAYLFWGERPPDGTGPTRELKMFFDHNRIPFGTILIGVGRSDCNYYKAALRWTAENDRLWRTHASVTANQPRDFIIQSWEASAAPRNLPENEPGVYSHARLINEDYAILTGAAPLESFPPVQCAPHDGQSGGNGAGTAVPRPRP